MWIALVREAWGRTESVYWKWLDTLSEHTRLEAQWYYDDSRYIWEQAELLWQEVQYGRRN